MSLRGVQGGWSLEGGRKLPGRRHQHRHQHQQSCRFGELVFRSRDEFLKKKERKKKTRKTQEREKAHDRTYLVLHHLSIIHNSYLPGNHHMPRVLFSSLLFPSLPSRLSPNPHPHPITSQQIPIRRTHIPQLRLLAFRQPLISHTNSLPLPILRPTRPAIDDTRENTQDSKGDADGVSIIIIDRRRNQYQYQDR